MAPHRATQICLAAVLSFLSPKVFAGSSGIVDIESGPQAKPVTTPSVPKEAPTAVVTPLSAMIHPTPTTPTPTPSPTPLVVHGYLKMKDVYRVGIKAYREKDYEKASRYLQASLDMEDAASPPYFKAEAHAMLGVIHQFHSDDPRHLARAREEYEAALSIDPKTKTALRHLKELKAKE